MADEGMTLAGIRRILVLEAEVADLQRQLANDGGRCWGDVRGHPSSLAFGFDVTTPV